MSGIAFYNAYTAMKAYQSNLDVVSNNLANVNTVGYREDRASFDDLLYQNMNVHNNEGKKVGLGVKVGSVTTKMTTGSLEMTGILLDFAITTENGFFATQKGEDGAITYTRSGDFNVSVEEDESYLVDSTGAYVLDTNGERIALERDANGTIDTSSLMQKIGVYSFANPYELEKSMGTRFTATEKSGEAELIENSSKVIYQGALERSPVDVGASMVEVISNQRAFQLNASLLKTADEIEDVINSLKR